jgi:N-acetylglucosamine-6-sulfatase
VIVRRGEINMRTILITIGTLCLLGAGLTLTQAQQAGRNQGACVQIRVACQKAGFAAGARGEGTGLVADCVVPIMQGTPQRPRASKPLPQIDPQLVTDCKAANPNFGQGARVPQQAPATAPPPVPASPPAAPEQRTPPAAAAGGKRPNIVFVLTDDLALNLVQYMPHVVQMQKDGVTFANYFVTDSLCCPSRTSIFTGRFPHDSGIYRNTGADGGFLAFHSRHHEQVTFATALQAAGYRTAMLGKYLNGYEPAKHQPEPGWSLWAVAGGAGYRSFNYALNEDGKVVRYGNQSSDYMTDVLSGIAVRFVKESAGTPFMIEIATFAPHAPYVPAPRDAEALPGLMAPRTAAFNISHQDNEPAWLARHQPIAAPGMAKIDQDFRKRAQSVQAVDAMIGALQEAIAAVGETNNTYFVFSSDNGYHMGEFRLMPGKMTAYDTDIRVPLIMTGPGIPPGRTVEEIVENIDLHQTFTDLGGAVAAPNVDGRSLVPLLRGQPVTDWRQAALIEHRGPVRNVTDPDFPDARSGNPPTYEAMRGPAYLYVEYADGEKEYHDLATDPDEIHNTFPSLPDADKASLHAALSALANCHDAQACSAAGGITRNATRN